MNKLTYSLNLVLVMAIVAVLAVFWQKPWEVGASVQQGNEYNSTSTVSGFGLVGAIPPATHTEAVLKSGSGAVGNVLITKTGGGSFKLFNATTSNINLRTGNKATSSIEIISFPVYASTTNWAVDAVFNDGLLFVGTGDFATSTITWR